MINGITKKQLSDIFLKNSKLWLELSKKQENPIAKNANKMLAISFQKLHEDLEKL